MVYLNRRYRFCASHRLHDEALTADENARLYGKCDSPLGHGHNYVLDVTVAGKINPSTGMVIDIGFLDRTVEEEIIARFDHTYLNLDVENFSKTVPTTENLCSEVFRLLAGRLNNGTNDSPRLTKVRLEETHSNFFEMTCD